MSYQRTSESAAEPVTDGQATLFGRMIQNAMKSYPGGRKKAELAKGHPDFCKRAWSLFDELAKEQTVYLRVKQLRPWKTIRIGTADLRSGEDFIRAIEDAGGRVSDDTKEILGGESFRVADEATELDLILVNRASSSFPRGLPFNRFKESCIRAGLEICPAEVGPQLRLQHMNQQKGESLIIIMDPIEPSDLGLLTAFSVGSDAHGDRWLYTDWENLCKGANIWLWLFCRKKK